MAADDPSEDVRPEVAAARRDPRLDHSRQAMIADWWAALAASERARRLTDWGLYELKSSLKREEERTGHRLGDASAPPDVRHALRAANERRLLAEAESENQMAELNAMTLVTLVGALDGMIEALAPSARELRVRIIAEDVLRRTRADLTPEQIDQLERDGGGLADRVRERLAQMLDEQLPRGAKKVGGRGAERWESVLRGAGLESPPGRPIPQDMDTALSEVVALRHVISHRASRVDVKALEAAPTLSYKEGELVRITRLDYRRYAAALRTYADEVIRRVFGPSEHDFDLAGWRENIPLGT